jgi:hypothetical protein
MEEPLDILCINCQDMISTSSLSAHSSVCIYPCQEVLLLEKEPLLQIIHFRVNRLCSALSSIAVSNLSTDKFYYKFLWKKAQELASIEGPSVEAVELTSAVAISVRKFAKTMIKPGLIMYSERLRELASEKTRLIIESLANSGCSKEILGLLQKKFAEIQKLQSKTAESTDKRQSIQALSESLQNIDEIASQVSRVLTQRSSTNSIVSFEENEEANFEDLDKMREANNKQETEKSMEDLHKYFYSKCLMVKLSFGSRHPSQLIQINELYKKVRHLDVPMEKWEEFIKNEFSHPERWVKST